MEVAEADAADVDIAVKAARKAFDEGPWPKMPARVSTSWVPLAWQCRAVASPAARFSKCRLPACLAIQEVRA